MAIDREKIIGAFAGAALTLGTMTCSALADYADITIRYGENIEDMGTWIEVIQDEGVKVKAINNLENPNCAAVVFDGKEVYRFSASSVDDATMADIAIAIAQGDDNHGFAESDCEVVIASAEL